MIIAVGELINLICKFILHVRLHNNLGLFRVFFAEGGGLGAIQTRAFSVKKNI